MKYIIAPLAALGTYALMRAYSGSFGVQNFWVLSGSGWAAFLVLGAVLYFWGRK